MTQFRTNQQVTPEILQATTQLAELCGRLTSGQEGQTVDLTTQAHDHTIRVIGLPGVARPLHTLHPSATPPRPIVASRNTDSTVDYSRIIGIDPAYESTSTGSLKEFAVIPEQGVLRTLTTLGGATGVSRFSTSRYMDIAETIVLKNLLQQPRLDLIEVALRLSSEEAQRLNDWEDREDLLARQLAANNS